MDKDILEKQYEEITDLTFDAENAHIAQCHTLQNGAANGWHQSLILKAEDVDQELIKALEQVQVKMSFEEFLDKFMNVYGMSAEMLAKMMGFETEREYNERLAEENDGPMYETFDEYMDSKLEKIEILRSAQDGVELTTEQKVDFLHVQKAFEDAVSEAGGWEEFEKAFSSAANGEEESGATENSDSDVTKTSGEGDSDITDTQDDEELNKGSDSEEGDSITEEETQIEVNKVTKEVEKSAAELDLEKAQARIEELEKAAAKAEAAEKALEKAAGRIEALEKAEEARIEKAYQNFAGTLSFMGEDADKEELVKALMTMRDAEAGVVLYSALEKAQAALSAMGEEEVGVEGEAEVIKGNAVLSDLIDKKYGTK